MGGTYPSVDLALILSDHGRDVVLHDGFESRFVGDGRHPCGKLRVPDCSVAADELGILNGEIYQDV